MKTIDAIIIAKDEQNNIADCIESLNFCRKVIVVDNGSEDNTVKISRDSGADVVVHVGKNFSELRNIGLNKVSSEYVIYVDADERVSQHLKKEIENVLSNELNTHEAFRVKRKNYYYGKNPWPYVEKLERVFKKDALIEWFGELHETPKVNGDIGDLAGYLMHYSHQDLSKMIEKTNEWSNIEAQLRYSSNHPKMSPWRFFRVMLTAFFNSYIRQGGYKAGTIGIIESIYQSFSIFITYAKLWELQNNKKV